MLDKFKRYWFLVSALLIAILYILWDKRGRTIGELVSEAQKQKLLNEMTSINEQARRSGADYDKAMSRYAELKRLHPEFFNGNGSATKQPPISQPGNGTTH
jgi:hypothetical protein